MRPHDREPDQGRPTRPGGNTLELVGKPIRRDSGGARGEAGRSGGQRPGPGGNRPAMPPGMRKPVAPGELMQLQKPTGRPAAPPPRRPDGTPVSPEQTGLGDPPVSRPTATPPSPATAPATRWIQTWRGSGWTTAAWPSRLGRQCQARGPAQPFTAEAAPESSHHRRERRFPGRTDRGIRR